MGNPPRIAHAVSGYSVATSRLTTDFRHCRGGCDDAHLGKVQWTRRKSTPQYVQPAGKGANCVTYESPSMCGSAWIISSLNVNAEEIDANVWEAQHREMDVIWRSLMRMLCSGTRCRTAGGNAVSGSTGLNKVCYYLLSDYIGLSKNRRSLRIMTSRRRLLELAHVELVRQQRTHPNQRPKTSLDVAQPPGTRV